MEMGFFRFNIVTKFWFLCQTYTFMKHEGKDGYGKYLDG